MAETVLKLITLAATIIGVAKVLVDMIGEGALLNRIKALNELATSTGISASDTTKLIEKRDKAIKRLVSKYGAPEIWSLILMGVGVLGVTASTILTAVSAAPDLAFVLFLAGGAVALVGVVIGLTRR